MKVLKMSFLDFHRGGNENQKILSKFSGEYEDERYLDKLSELYTFSFVDVKTEKYNDADGTSKTKVKTEYKRYGVVVDLNHFSNIAIYSTDPI